MIKKFFRKKNIDIALLYGGISPYETDISVMTMKKVAQAFDHLGFSYIPLKVDLDIIKNLKNLKPKRVFLAVHGLFGEDGGLQSVLELLRVPYTGSGVASSALCMDKIFFKKWMNFHNILTPEFKVLEKEKSSEAPFLPCVVKPCCLGSSIGVFICHTQEEWNHALEKVFKLSDRVLVEEYIQGKEIAVPWLEPRSLAPVEIVPKSGFYDFNSKYVSGDTQYFVPARINSELTEKLKKITQQVCSLSQVRSYGRADYMVKDEKIYLIEMNTLPGLTEHSLVPKSALHEGISYEELISKILEQTQ